MSPFRRRSIDWPRLFGQWLGVVVRFALVSIAWRIGWNLFMPDLFGFPRIVYWQAAAMLWLLASATSVFSTPRRVPRMGDN